MNHVKCGGKWVLWTIREHHYSFMRCDRCGNYSGGEAVKKKVNRLMATKVSPTMRRL